MFPGILKNLLIGSLSKRNFSSQNDMRFGKGAHRFSNVAVDAVINKDIQHESAVSNPRQNFSGAFQNPSCKFNRSESILFGDAGILPGDFVEGVAGSKEIQNISNGNASPADRGFAETDIGIDSNSIGHRNRNDSKQDGEVKTGNGKWTKVMYLAEGQHIAVRGSSGNAAWDRIEKIERLPVERVYDIEVEGTHNFIGNDIVAHNTYITAGLGVGTATTSA